MHTARRHRVIHATPQELWDVVSDPHHLPRWWPRVSRVEAVEGDAFTEVLKTAKGKLVRADFTLVEVDEVGRRLVWSQELEGSPWERLLASAETEVRLMAKGGDTDVTIELRQALTGFFPRFGGFLVRRAASATLDEALDGLERIGV
ncbi:MAG TPA: SRPBCC family protein [Solirubrobacteraceae bacterium]